MEVIWGCMGQAGGMAGGFFATSIGGRQPGGIEVTALWRKLVCYLLLQSMCTSCFSLLWKRVFIQSSILQCLPITELKYARKV